MKGQQYLHGRARIVIVNKYGTWVRISNHDTIRSTVLFFGGVLGGRYSFGSPL